MRVLCPQHKIGFFTPRRNPIRCENRGHVLGEFNFHGDANVPVETLWQYCCNCEHFCPIELDRGGLEACPACSRRISQRYMCDRCFTVSLESATPIEAKNFTLTSDGTPQPSCPGCFQESSGELRDHECEKLGAHFITALSACPACLEQLDIGPVFPCSVAHYLKKTRAANKRNVTFDYATGLFVLNDNGEFVLVSGGSENSRPIVLPHSPRFQSKRDFYDLYQDYYHCTKVGAGDVYIIEPAFVESVRGGWKLQSMGVLKIVDEEAKTIALTSDIPIETEVPGRKRSAIFSASLTEEPPAVIEEVKPVSPRFLANDDELTVSHDVATVQSSPFSWALPQPSETVSRSSRPGLIAIVISGFLLITLGGLLLNSLLSRLGRSADAQQMTANLRSDAAPKVEPTTVHAETKAQPPLTVDSAEQELQKLHDRRIGSSPSDRLTVLQLFTTAEQRHPNDYRFPYERAKLAIDGRETKSHDDAFNALFLAGAEAIKSNKTQEMLGRLAADRFGDFHKLSHGHREWTQIIEALQKKDPTLLSPQFH